MLWIGLRRFLFPPFQNILANVVEEFIPYSLRFGPNSRRKAGRSTLRRSLPPASFRSTFSHAVETRGKTSLLLPALGIVFEKVRKPDCRLKQALKSFLGFSKGISSTATQNHAFGIIISIIEDGFSRDVSKLFDYHHASRIDAPFVPRKSLQFAKKYVSLFVRPHKNTAQPYAVGRSTPFKPDCSSLSQQIIAYHVDKARTHQERKRLAIGLTRICCDDPTILSQRRKYGRPWSPKNCDRMPGPRRENERGGHLTILC